MNKTIHINPNLFKISGTRKRSTEPKLTISTPKEKNATLSKRNSLLKFIRRHQDNNNIKQDIETSNLVQETDNQFENSLQYLMDISDSVDQSHENVNIAFPEQTSIPTVTTPQYGCLKNGTLPTYRQFYNRQTLKNHTGMGKRNDDIIKTDLGKNMQNEYNVDNYMEPFKLSTGNMNTEHMNTEHINTEHINTENMHTENINNNHDNKVNETQRKVLKRTYKTGKSNAERKISVLVSNKTIRNNSSNKSITLKKTPINDVRRYLVKQGFIKVGTTAPPDVLRKMYESASMVCGDVTNHNSETLMYNFLNSAKKSW
jgi:hypothetical protein